MGTAISVRGLAKRFRQTTALDGVDLDVEKGEVFGLVGPNGAGKTTLLQLLAALLDPSAGRAVVLGHDVFADTERLRSRIGYLSQDFSLYGSLGVEENLDFIADLYGVPGALRDQRKETLLGWSRLAPFRGRRARPQSGGLQKTVQLCWSRSNEPELKLLGGPPTGRTTRLGPTAVRNDAQRHRAEQAEALTRCVGTEHRVRLVGSVPRDYAGACLNPTPFSNSGRSPAIERR